MDARAFQKSVNAELTVIKNRVRDLIGKAHWGEEGRYKEAILRSVIQRSLPSNISLGTGFVVSVGRDHAAYQSSQLDIIAYDNTYPPLFQEGDFIVTTPANVRGVIEVKTNAANFCVRDAVEEASEAAHAFKNFDARTCFNGLFIYENAGAGERRPFDVQGASLKETLVRSAGAVNHLSIGPKWFMKFWGRGTHPEGREAVDRERYTAYELERLGFAYFISNFVDYVCDRNMEERSGFLYPGEKEGHRRFDVPVEPYAEGLA